MFPNLPEHPYRFLARVSQQLIRHTNAHNVAILAAIAILIALAARYAPFAAHENLARCLASQSASTQQQADVDVRSAASRAVERCIDETTLHD